MTEEYTLVIVDMQHEFLSWFIEKTRNRLVENTCNFVALAMRDDAPIILVEYGGCGQTHGAIYETIEDYLVQETVTKYTADGSQEIIEAIESHNWPKKLLVCGIYGNECVFDTVDGLRNKYDVSILPEAIEPPFPTQLMEDAPIEEIYFSNLGVTHEQTRNMQINA